MMKYILGLAMMSATPALSDDTEQMSSMLKYIYAKEWDSAKLAAQAADDPVIYEVYLWNSLRGGVGEFEDYEQFLDENDHWPGLPWLQTRGEIYISETLDPDRVIEFIEPLGPQTGFGLSRYLQALVAKGDIDKANSALLEAAASIRVPRSDMDRIAPLGLSGFEDAKNAQVKFLLYERERERASEYLDILSPKQAGITRARLNVLAGISEGTEVENGGVAYDKMRVAKNAKDYAGAMALMRATSTSRKALDEPTAWADDRFDFARQELWNGRADAAYALASSHFLEAEEDGYSELEFLSGLIALEFLDKPQLALNHFQNFKNTVNTPISNGRAGYWLGRAGDPDGFAYGAQWQTSFYGQLSAEKLGNGYDAGLIVQPNTPDYALRDFMTSENIRAALRYYAAGDVLTARRFMAHDAETLPADDAESLGQLAFVLDMPDAAVNIGKNLAMRAEVVTNSYYPMPDYLGDDLDIPEALALGIMRQESEFYPRAESHVGARGLMQLMPGTAQDMTNLLELDYSHDALLDEPSYNVALGSRYLSEMLLRFDGQLPLAVLSYNAGPGRGDRWQEKLGGLPKDADAAVLWLEQIPFDETRNYVQRVLEATFLYQAKIDGEYGRHAPSDLITARYPKDTDYAALRLQRQKEEEARAARRAAEAAAAANVDLEVPPARPEI